MSFSDPQTVVARQLAAYNAHDFDAWLATYADEAQQWLSDGTLLARDRPQIAQRMRPRFDDPHLHADLLQRLVVGPTVVDHERVTRTGANGLERVEMVCVYAVDAGRIARATFAFGEPQAVRPAAPR